MSSEQLRYHDLLPEHEARLLEPSAIQIEHPLEQPSAERIQKGRGHFEKNLNEFIISAIQAHLHAVNYRLLRVGATTDAEFKDGRYAAVSTHNAKFVEHEQQRWAKLCAENNGCTISIKDGAVYIAGIVTVCEELEKNSNEGNGFKHIDETLSDKVVHPCRNCRNLFRELIKKNYMSRETMIVCVNDSSLLRPPEVVESDPESYDLVADPNMDKPKKVPKLRLLAGKEKLTDKDIANLPIEVMTIGKLLDIYEEADKTPFKSGYAPAPSFEKFSEAEVLEEFSVAVKYSIELYKNTVADIKKSLKNPETAMPTRKFEELMSKRDKAASLFVNDIGGRINDALGHGAKKEQLKQLLDLDEIYQDFVNTELEPQLKASLAKLE